MSPKALQKYPVALETDLLPFSVSVYDINLPFFSPLMRPSALSSFNAGYSVPGLGFSPLLFPISFAISSPCILFFESSQSIWNESRPRISHP